jgi:hypothetical protein
MADEVKLQSTKVVQMPGDGTGHSFSLFAEIAEKSWRKFGELELFILVRRRFG